MISDKMYLQLSLFKGSIKFSLMVQGSHHFVHRLLLFGMLWLVQKTKKIKKTNRGLFMRQYISEILSKTFSPRIREWFWNLNYHSCTTLMLPIDYSFNLWPKNLSTNRRMHLMIVYIWFFKILVYILTVEYSWVRYNGIFKILKRGGLLNRKRE